MLALYREGRQNEALTVYQRTRRLMIDELGVEPGAGLRDLHQKMLAADPQAQRAADVRMAAEVRITRLLSRRHQWRPPRR